MHKRDALREELEKAKENTATGGLTDGKINLSGMNEDELERQLNQLKVREDEAQGKLDSK